MTPESHLLGSALLRRIAQTEQAIHYWSEVIKSPEMWLRKCDAAQPRDPYELPDYMFPPSAIPTELEFTCLKFSVLKRLREELARLKTALAEL